MNYTTSSLALAAFLISSGFTITNTSEQEEGGYLIFSFQDSARLQKAVKDFYGNKKIPALDFWNAIKNVKSMVHQLKRG